MFIKYATFNINSLQKTTTCKFPSPVNQKKNLKYLKTMHFLNAHYFCLIWCNSHNQLKSNKNNTTPSRCKQIICIQSKE